MTFQDNLIKARSHITFIVALGCGLTLVTHLDGAEAKRSQAAQPAMVKAIDPIDVFENIDPLPIAAPRPLSVQELNYARIAWRYFENNTDPETGLVNSANNYPSTTMWETGAYLIAVASAELIGLIDQDQARTRIEMVLDSLIQQRLFDDTLPNKAYNTRTIELVDYGNKPSEKGLGWSALDMGRMLSGLGVARHHYPDLSPKIEVLLAQWPLDRMIRDGELIGTNVVDGETVENQEGRVGYEQYAAKAMMLFGHDVYRAFEVNDNLMVQWVEGNPIPVDTRLHRNTIPAFVVSEPYLFDGLEFGFDARSSRFASAIYGAQEARYRNTGVLTAVSESHVTGAPYFVYSTIWGGGDPWAVLTFRGERMDDRRTMATKVAFAWDALFDTDYTNEILQALTPLGDPSKGWPEGIYEIDGTTNASTTLNTNAVVLTSLAFKAFGPLFHAAR